MARTLMFTPEFDVSTLALGVRMRPLRGNAHMHWPNLSASLARAKI
jgi:hypothetical protein